MPKKIESLEQVEPVSYEGRYICLNGMNYADVRRERGDIVDDIPADSLEWLLEWGHVEPYTGQVLGDPPAIPHVERRVRKQNTEALEAEEAALTIVAAEEAAMLADHIVDANEMVELAEAGYPIIEPVVVVLEQEESDVREAVIAEIDEQQAAEGE